jgi:WD40 repeat protein
VFTLTDGWRWPVVADSLLYTLFGSQVRTFEGDALLGEFTVCTGTRATTTVVGDLLYIGCEDGVLRAYDGTGAERAAISLGETPPSWSTVIHRDGRLLVGRLDGNVRSLDLSTGAWGPALASASGAVLELRPVPESALVLVRGERGGLRLWDTRTDTWVGSLPGRAGRMYAGVAPGEVRLLGAELTTWRVDNDTPPSVLHFGVGLSQIAIAPDGGAVAVALGTGDVVARRVSDGGTTGRWNIGDGVAKCVTFLDDGSVLAGSRAGARRLTFDGAVTPYGGSNGLRRMGALSDGRSWSISYGGELLVEGERVVLPEPGRLFEGSSAANGLVAGLLDEAGGIWRLGTSGLQKLATAHDAVAVDVTESAGVVFARRRELCFADRCVDIPSEVLDISVADGRIAVGTLNGDVRLLDQSDLATLAVFRRHTSRVSSVELDPGGRWLWSGSWDGTARKWDLTDLDAPAELLVGRSEGRWGLDLDAALGGG